MKTIMKHFNSNKAKSIIKFETVYKLLLSAFLIPCMTYIMWLAMRVSGLQYLTAENFIDFVKSPMTISFISVLLFLLAFLTLFDMVAIVVINDISYQKMMVSFRETVAISIKKTKELLHFHKIGIAFLLLLLVPFFNFGIFTNVYSTFKIPEIISRFIHKHVLIIGSVTLGYFILSFFLMRWIYALHYMVMEGSTLKNACKQSRKLMEGYWLQDTFKLIALQLLFSFIYVFIVLIGVMLILLIGNAFSHFKIIESISLTIVVFFLVIILSGFSILSNAISYSLICRFFYQHKEEKKEKIVPIYLEDTSLQKQFPYKRILAACFSLAFIGGCIQMFLLVTGKTNLNIESLKKVEVTAHRGASKFYPENTMSAFIGAKNMGADWIELDIQQTKDGQIVVSHDANLRRVAGINKEINDLTYEELKTIDVGSFFDPMYSGERIPKLDEVLQMAAGSMVNLNIELKPTGKEINFEKQVIDIIKEYHFEDKCVVTSQEYQVIENIKKIDKSIKTVYVTSIAIGNITNLSDADAFSVESINANKPLIKKIHNEGKEIYVWTVNDEENMQRMIELGVDNIITDDILSCRRKILENRNSDYITKIIKKIQ